MGREFVRAALDRATLGALSRIVRGRSVDSRSQSAIAKSRHGLALASLVLAWLVLELQLPLALATDYTLKVLDSFDAANGSTPYAGLTADAAGNLYGTTLFGGAFQDGAVFKISAGSESINLLASFDGQNGAGPHAGVIVDAAGNLFGTTTLALDAAGTVYKIPAGSGTITRLAAFTNNDNGWNAYGRLLADSAGNLYGTAQQGGAAGAGAVFEVHAGSNALTTLAAFDPLISGTGTNPQAGLLADAAGNFFGTTNTGGPNNRGTVFEIVAGSGKITTLASFNSTNGASPQGDLIADAAGNLYGTTRAGGQFNQGTVFEIVAGSGKITSLASFNVTNGSHPVSALIADAQGNLYGTTSEGGAFNKGTVFEIVKGSGVITTLASFDGTNGATPRGGLVADSHGNFFGTTSVGGDNGLGVVFKLTPVPEPNTACLAMLGACSLIMIAQRRAHVAKR